MTVEEKLQAAEEFIAAMNDPQALTADEETFKFVSFVGLNLAANLMSIGAATPELINRMRDANLNAAALREATNQTYLI